MNMSCCHPFKAWKTGYKTEKGKDDYIMATYASGDEFDLARAKKPVDLSKVSYTLRNGHIFLTDPVDVPCGSCVGCRMQKAREWKIRNCLELTYHKEAYFLTLTYDDAHLPHNEFGEPVYDYRDVQLFLKRLRKLGDYRFFGSAEFGEKTYRPHFHMILYGHLEGFKLYKPNCFTCPVIAELWPHGSHLIEYVTPGSIAYVSGYVEKKQIDYENVNFPVKPRLFMSRKPGIGMAYIQDNLDKIKSTWQVYGKFGDGIKCASATVPHAFRRKFDGEPWYEEIKEAAKLAGEKMEEMAKVIYKIVDRPALQDAQERSLYKTVQMFRKEKL